MKWRNDYVERVLVFVTGTMIASVSLISIRIIEDMNLVSSTATSVGLRVSIGLSLFTGVVGGVSTGRFRSSLREHFNSLLLISLVMLLFASFLQIGTYTFALKGGE